MAVRNRLKEIRMQEYMENGKEFCNRIGIPQSTYSPLESNKKQGTADTMFKIARALNKKIEEIWYWED